MGQGLLTASCLLQLFSICGGSRTYTDAKKDLPMGALQAALFSTGAQKRFCVSED